MKNKANRRLLWVFLISTALSVLLFCSLYGGWIPWLELTERADDRELFYTLSEYYSYLTLASPAVPFFCLQLLLCRILRQPWTRPLLTFSILAAFLLSIVGFFSATGWDSLGWGVLLCLLAAPAAGCVLAWAVYGFHYLYKKEDLHG